MANFVVGIVDGTGAWNDNDYAVEMHDSFCRQIFDAIKEPTAKYLRGPSNDGLSVRSKAYEIADWITSDQKKPGAGKVYLAGYSRGASAVIYAAELLQERAILVDAMFLFDAVSRHAWSALGGTTVPANVLLTLHAMRQNSPEMIRKYEGTINGGLGNPLRPWFGHTGLKILGPRFQVKPIAGSHGALGGVGWTHVVTEGGKTDWDSEQAVVDFMNPTLQKALGVTLEAREPRCEPSTSLATRAVGGVDRFAMHPVAEIRAGYDALRNRLR